MPSWHIYTGDPEPHGDALDRLPEPPPWRTFAGGPLLTAPRDDPEAADAGHRAVTYRASAECVDMVNAALYLRRPLLVTGPPGSGKSSLPYAVARELRLGPVLRWNISSRATAQDGLYQYDPLSRLYAAGRNADGGGRSEERVEDHIRLGPLGTALLPYDRPRVLLIDEIDKSDLDLPNDLLNIMEEGRFEIPELARLARHAPQASVMVYDSDERVTVVRGRVRCAAFPFIVLTSNGEREFPPAFLRRCVRLRLRQPRDSELREIVSAHLGVTELGRAVQRMIEIFLNRSNSGELATDQLLNAVYMTGASGLDESERDKLAEALMSYLSGARDDAGF